MSPVIDPEGGRSAASWDAAIADLAVARAWPPAGHWVVVAPHPDDEVLGVGGALARAAADDVAVDVVTVTDGEASHPGLARSQRRALAVRRRRESRAADVALGLRSRRHFLGLPDGAVAHHEDHLVDLLVPLLADRAVVATVVVDDGHPDHDATGRACTRAAARHGLRVVHHAVWAWNWDLDTTGRLAGATRLALTTDELARKRRAVDAHASQVTDRGEQGPVVPAGALAHHLRQVEVLWADPA